MYPASDAALIMPRARMVVEDRVQIKAACSEALCCRLGLPIPSHDCCAMPLLALSRVLRLATADDLRRRDRSPVDATAGYQGPDDPRHLVGQRRPHQHRWLAREHPAQPRAGLRHGIRAPLDDHAVGPRISRRLRERSPILVVAPRRCLPPVECCLGVSPSQAAKSRARRNVSGGGASVASAVAISGPMPGIVISRRAVSSSRARRAISASSVAIRSSRWRSPSTRTDSVARAVFGRLLSGGSISATSRHTFQAP